MNFARAVVLRWLVFIGVLTTSLASDAGKYPVSETMQRQMALINKIKGLFPKVEANVRWLPCGGENSAYSPYSHTIYLCTEFAEAHPGAAVAVAAHEMAHAVTDQLTDTTGEQDADELGALLLIKFGYQEELLDLAIFFAEKDPAHEAGDEHPGPGYRAWELACIEDGSEKGGSDDCKLLYRGLLVRWEHRLAHP
jgi:hypothetical protein